MPQYKITNNATGECKEAEADFLGNAVAALGWDIAKCTCEILPPKKRGRPPKQPPDTIPEKPADAKPTETSPPVPQELVDRARAAGEADQIEAAAVDKFKEKMEKEIEELDIHRVTGDASPAEKEAYKHKQEIEQLAIGAEVMFLNMGKLLYDARIGGEWSILHYESYREYVEDLKLPMTNSYSWATRLSSIYEYLVKNMKLSNELLAEIGVAKLTRLLPLARKGELTEAIIKAACTMSDLDLRETLGHNVGSNTEPDIVICPRCGQVFDASHASRP